MDALLEFNRQTQTLLDLDYPQLAHLTKAAFLDLLPPIKSTLSSLPTLDSDLESGYLPFILVTSSSLIPAVKMMSLTSKDSKPGITKLTPLEPSDFTPIHSLSLPSNPLYLLVGVDRGKSSLNVRPEDALKSIMSTGRSPLTIDEGIAIVTHYPEFLAKNNCFSLLASRHSGDQRVPAIWINSAKHPNLGWCWDRNPHTWLGSASCSQRI